MGNHCLLVVAGESSLQGFIDGASFRPSTLGGPRKMLGFPSDVPVTQPEEGQYKWPSTYMPFPPTTLFLIRGALAVLSLLSKFKWNPESYLVLGFMSTWGVRRVPLRDPQIPRQPFDARANCDGCRPTCVLSKHPKHISVLFAS